ncbi:MAG: hypothetical protein IPM02_27575 [Betaproteobacteria bacterium]|nr:hypothetical protein [Betaproteobacteria bacterium]
MDVALDPQFSTNGKVSMELRANQTPQVLPAFFCTEVASGRLAVMGIGRRDRDLPTGRQGRQIQLALRGSRLPFARDGRLVHSPRRSIAADEAQDLTSSHGKILRHGDRRLPATRQPVCADCRGNCYKSGRAWSPERAGPGIELVTGELPQPANTGREAETNSI